MCGVWECACLVCECVVCVCCMYLCGGGVHVLCVYVWGVCKLCVCVGDFRAQSVPCVSVQGNVGGNLKHRREYHFLQEKENKQQFMLKEVHNYRRTQTDAQVMVCVCCVYVCVGGGGVHAVFVCVC